MDTKLLKLAAVAVGAYVVVSWALSQRDKGQSIEIGLPGPEPVSPPSPPEYPTDPFFCHYNPDHPMCQDIVLI